MGRLTSFCLLSILVLSSCVKEEPQDVTSYLNLIQGDSISNHVKFLASDSLKGRLPGTPEFGVAIEYVIGQYKKLGLKAAGEDQEYTQTVKVRNSKIVENLSSLSWNGKDLSQNEDYYFIGNLNEDSTNITADVVFAGYGISAPSYDDYSMIDASGKVVLVLMGGPSSLQSAELAHFSNYETKYNTAAEKGAVGILFIRSNPSLDSTFNSRALATSNRGNFGVVGENGVAFGRRTFPDQLKFSAFINSISMASKSLDAAISEYLENKIDGQSLGTINAITRSLFSEFLSSNVIGMIEGSDPDLKSEFVVHTAHLDHVGIGRPVRGDSIYNGAHDNASGVASLLEIARIYQSLKTKPKRSILFVMVTAEEMGLLGSAYFAEYPTVPLEKIVANVNTDMPTLIAPLLSIEPLGAEHSSLMNPVMKSAQILGLEVSEDHMPEEVRFVRSDQYNFIKKGIPALHVKYGLKSNDPEFDLERAIRNYTRRVYHRPSDEWNELFNWEAGEVYVKCNFLISYFIADDDKRPTWNPNSFFNPERPK